METIIYVRVARDRGGKIKIRGTEKSSVAQLEITTYPKATPLPTVFFALRLDIPDAAFKRAETVIAELKLKEEDLHETTKVTPVHDEIALQ